MPASSPSVIPVWVAAFVGAVLVAVFSASAAIVWLPVVMAGAVLLTFVIQLGVSRKEGLVSRIVASLAGAFLILAAATLVLVVWAGTGIPASV
ncbi:hypothetical protein [Homoserinibacter sp. GY 40078]|uniref:hypothetical protein n=1 Tax=Homoserinibacter sp. GY 40078 TaxID=2603275 RepID=UPI0011CA142B|nr:hypothetical protein [Homoserinibacter sp. GY 40078]TXK19332.1 hypothetical protein FVQ89_05310 [Homoserinibacter sp. GY 40078]